MAKVFALDQNFFRSTELESVIAAEPTAKFVLLDIALLEMAKGEKWWETMRGSLAILSNKRGRILASISIAEALRYEMDTLRCAQPNMVCKESTSWLRALVSELAANDPDGPVVARFKALLPAVQHELSLDELDHAKNLNRLKDTTEKIKTFFGQAGIKALKHPGCTTGERLAAVYVMASVLAKDFLVEKGHSPARVRNFLKGNPLLFRYYLALVRHGMEWARMGGIENLIPEKATNDAIDQQYVVAGSFFDGLLSREGKVKTADQELRLMLSIKNPGGIAIPPIKSQ